MPKEIIGDVVLRYISQQEFKRLNYADGPKLAGGVNGPGWYWACFDEKRSKTDDDWWFGPESTKEMAHFVATQDQWAVVAESEKEDLQYSRWRARIRT